MKNTVVRAAALTRRFGSTLALDQLSLNISKGRLYALVGPDGAGKTTFIRTVGGLLKPDTGSIEVFGHQMPANRNAVLGRVGYLSQDFSLYGDLSIDENIAFFAEIYGSKDYRTKRDSLLDMTGLTEFRGRLADRLSGGMKKKLALACTLVHNPQLILLDEPTTGVDPVSRREFWKLLGHLREQGITMLLSTPYMDEAERADQVGFLLSGRLVAEGSPSALRVQDGRKTLEIVCSDARTARYHLAGAYPDLEVQVFGDRLHALVGPKTISPEKILSSLIAGNCRIDSSRLLRPRLENIFLSYMKHNPVNGMAT